MEKTYGHKLLDKTELLSHAVGNLQKEANELRELIKQNPEVEKKVGQNIEAFVSAVHRLNADTTHKIKDFIVAALP